MNQDIPKGGIVLYKNFDDLFEQQAQALLKKEWDKAAHVSREEFQAYIYGLKDQIPKESEIHPRNIPFLIVMPRDFVPLYIQLQELAIEANIQCEDIVYSELKIPETLPQALIFPYLVIDIEVGIILQGRSWNSCSSELTKQKRSGLTTEEILALANNYPTLPRFMMIAGCQCKGGCVPVLVNLGKNHLRLDQYSNESNNPYYIPSCRERRF